MYCRTRSENFFQYGMAVVVLLLCMQFQPSVSAIFILHPNNTTVLIRTNATFTCKVENGAVLEWLVQLDNTNDFLSTMKYPEYQNLSDLGMIWSVDGSAEGSNATITIPGTELTNCTTVKCGDIAAQFQEERFSSQAKLIVLGSPARPEPVAVLINSTFHISWNEPFTWPNHSISNYTISAEISTSEMEVLTPTILPPTTNSYTLDGSSYGVCTEVLFKVTATSDLGESRAGNATAGIPRVPGSIYHGPNISIDLTFTQDLTPMVEITFELPSICPFQEEKYEINIYEIREAGKELVYTLNHTYRGNSATFVDTSSVPNLSKDKVYFFSVATPRGEFSANKTFNTTLIISSPTTITTQSITSGEGDAGPPYLYIGIGVGVFVVLLLLLLLLCCSIVVCKLCCSKSDQKTKKKKDVDSSTWDSFLTNQNDILRQARAENPRTASTYESIDEYQEKAMLSTQMQSLAQKSSSLDRYQKHPMQQLPPPAVPDRRHSREESPYTTMGSAPSTLQNQQKHDLKNQGSPQHPSIYPSLDTGVVPNNDETRVSGGSAGYFSSASGGDDVNAYDHITPMDPLAEQSKQDIPGESFMGSQDEGHFVQTEC